MAKTLDRVRPEADREPRVQCAAVPWRRNGAGQVEVLLITSRETRRWVIPKGWPMGAIGPGGTAAQEALEEAGVLGRLGKKVVGRYAYDKRLRSGRIQRVKVRVFALEVLQELDDWPEKGQRERRWAPRTEAARLVDEAELQTLLATFEP
jgi:8-oxo-dGTP pyrophosphatase MutT (NUDIX family)